MQLFEYHMYATIKQTISSFICSAQAGALCDEQKIKMRIDWSQSVKKENNHKQREVCNTDTSIIESRAACSFLAACN